MASGVDPPGGSGFLVEEFIHSITTQLDRVQDALRIKAINRPLTYALKELHLELKVFVDMDPTGNVRLRASGPGDAGASVISMDFTTITKPMIEENTISLAATRSTPLEELGLSGDEKSRLERLGVTNLSQLDRLKGSTGVGTVARLADVSVDRLRHALLAGQPRVDAVRPGKPPVKPPPRPTRPLPKAPAAPRPATPAPLPTPPIVTRPQPRPTMPRPAPRSPVGRPPIASRPAPTFPSKRTLDEGGETFATPFATQVLYVPADSRYLTLEGANLTDESFATQVALNGEALDVEETDHDRWVVKLPAEHNEGVLEIRLGDQAPIAFALMHEPLTHETQAHAPQADETSDTADTCAADAVDHASSASDPWAPLRNAPLRGREPT